MKSHYMGYELAWAAGLFEGEGCVTTGSNYRLLLTLAMTDHDVVERFREALGCGTVYAIERRERRKDGGPRKQQYCWRCENHNAYAVMTQLWPWLGARRRAKYEWVLEKRKEWEAAKGSTHICVTCGDSYVPAVGPRQRYCSPRCGWVWRNAEKRRQRGPGRARHVFTEDDHVKARAVPWAAA